MLGSIKKLVLFQNEAKLSDFQAFFPDKEGELLYRLYNRSDRSLTIFWPLVGTDRQDKFAEMVDSFTVTKEIRAGKAP